MREGGEPSSGAWASVTPRIDHPLSWSLPLGRLGATGVRIHFSFLAYVLIELGRSLPAPDARTTDPLDFERTSVALGCLLAVVLAHDCVRAAACRRYGGEPGELLLWPAGGLGGLRPGVGWARRFLTAAAAPIAALGATIVVGAALLALTGSFLGVALPSPFALPGIGELSIEGPQPQPWWLVALFTLHHVNFTLLLVHLLPLPPLDGHRMLLALLERSGRGDAAHAAARVALAGGAVAAAAGALLLEWRLVALGAIGFVAGWQSARHASWPRRSAVRADDALDERASAVVRGEPDPDSESPDDDASTDGEDPEAVPAAAADDEIDRILEKIGRSGMQSLTDEERERLEEATRRRRGR